MLLFIVWFCESGSDPACTVLIVEVLVVLMMGSFKKSTKSFYFMTLIKYLQAVLIIFKPHFYFQSYGENSQVHSRHLPVSVCLGGRAGSEVLDSFGREWDCSENEYF